MDPPPNPSAVRVLIRPPSSSSSSATTPSSAVRNGNSPLSSAPTPSPPPPAPPEGVVVVGFLSSRAGVEVTHLINRLLDANVFGSGNLDKDLLPRGRWEEWFRDRRISYHHVEDKGVVFLRFTSFLPAVELLSSKHGSDDDFDLALDELESEDLRGMLFMFSVCHIIIFLHEGAHFDTHILKKFRMLQGAKNAFIPFIRTSVAPGVASKVAAPVVQPPVRVMPSRSPGRAGSSRHGSTVSLMSSSGSQSSILPGYCTPVILFVFYDEFLDVPCPAFSGEDFSDTLPNQPSSSNGTPKPSIASKASNPVVVLARPTSKTEGAFRKKLQSSLDSQIRFLIKKCRTLTGMDYNSRGAGNMSSVPLFSLDTSRAVALLDKSTNYNGRSLDFIADLVEDALNSKASLDIFVLENQSQGSNIEDLHVIKEFIFRHSDLIRGRGGLLSGSAAGVGMVAAAAAAAAASASASAGKSSNAPRLLSLENWASSSSIILDALLSVKRQFVDGVVHQRLSLHKDASSVKEGSAAVGNDAVEAAVFSLDGSRALNLKFSTLWCQKALPAAKEVYMKDLPSCYPTTVHKSQLEKALHAFQSMVKGPAVQMFLNKLEDECTSIWESGRQLCDAISLTGKPCMYRRHSVDALDSTTLTKQHSSGYIFIHACTCGRSRRIRDDPFDFDSANVSFFCFPSCENFLPSFVLPKGVNEGPVNAASWSLVVLGGANYYDPSKGMLQNGFHKTEKYLSKWTIVVGRQTEANERITCDSSVHLSLEAMPTESHEVNGQNATLIIRDTLSDFEHTRKSPDITSTEASNIHFGSSLPSLVVKKKAFSEVVAGFASGDSSFPPLVQQKKQSKAGCGKGIGPVETNQVPNQAHLTMNPTKPKNIHCTSVQENSHSSGNTTQIGGDPYLKIGSYVVPMHVHEFGITKVKSSAKKYTVYVGFEHECPHGHRFLLSLDHLKGLDPSHFESRFPPSKNEESNRIFAIPDLKPAKDYDKHHLQSAETSRVNVKKPHKLESFMHHSAKGEDNSGSTDSLEENLPFVSLNDGGEAFSLLNRDLPLYMNCPHCKNSVETNREKCKFAGTISQLQRIFLVTPPFPVVLATCPIIKFQESCLPSSNTDQERHSSFSFGCRVILPPESFLTLRLPFVYGVRSENENLQPLHYIERQPEITACLLKGTTLHVVSKDYSIDNHL